MRDMVIEYVEGQAAQLRANLRLTERYLDYLRSLPKDSETAVQYNPAAPIREAVYEILTKAGRPLDRDYIFEALARQGVEVGGKIPLKNLSAHMSNDPRIESVGRGIWGLVEWRSVGRTPVQSQSIPLEEIGSIESEGIGEEDLPF